MTIRLLVPLVLLLTLQIGCGGGGGGGAGSCTEGQACAPTTSCHSGRISCASGAPVCLDTGTAADGSACGSGGTCQSGVCKRTVSGTFQTTYWADDGAKVTLNTLPTPTFGISGPPATPSALLVPDSSTSGYAKFAFSVDANQSFSVPGVPVGTYFLELDKADSLPVSCVGGGIQVVSVVIPQLFELTADVPDLQVVTSARRDVAAPVPTTFTNVAFDITNMDPWVPGESIQVVSSQALTNYRAFFSPAPAATVTSFMGTSPWFGERLPDATKGDVVFVHQRVPSTVMSGASTASVVRSTKFARLKNLTVVDGATSNAAVPLIAAPQTGSLSTNIQSSQFAALAADVNPRAATLLDGAIVVLAAPHSVSYPDMPASSLAGVATVGLQTNLSDADYGAVVYGHFLDPFWKEFRRVSYEFEIGTLAFGRVQSDLPISGLGAGAITPVIGPPKSPLVNGNDAFSFNTGVGLQPTISWSSPALGTATSYLVEIVAATLDCTSSGGIGGISALVRTGTSFKVPAGVLRTGTPYRVTITARQAPWDTADAGPFRTGTPLHIAQCVSNAFIP